MEMSKRVKKYLDEHCFLYKDVDELASFDWTNIEKIQDHEQMYNWITRYYMDKNFNQQRRC